MARWKSERWPSLTALAARLIGMEAFAAPLASFGAIAVGQCRPSWDRPAKSAALGLVAGALGLDRSDAERARDARKGAETKDLGL
jgi:CRISPR system Cascade subunit CasD